MRLHYLYVTLLHWYFTDEVSEEIISPEQSQRSTLRDEVAPPKVDTEEEESETPPVESDSEGVMIAPKPSKRKQKPESKPVCLTVCYIVTELSTIYPFQKNKMIE